MTPIRIEYTEELVKRAVFEFWKRTVGVGLPVALMLMVVLFAYLIWSGDRTWMVGLLGTMIALAIIVVVAVYLVHYRNSMQKFRNMRDPSAMLELHDEHLNIKSDAGSGEVRKTLITEVWVYADFWLVFLSRSQFFTIPTTTLSLTDVGRVKSKFDEWGLKVIE